MIKLGTIPVESPPPAELQKFLASEIDRWGDLIETGRRRQYALTAIARSPTSGNEDGMSEEDVLRDKTATLTRMLNLQGTIGMFGHVSIRVPGTDKCFISPGASTDKTTVRPEQMFVYNIDGTIIDIPAD